jgi:glycosyltransferase involved in cell wall biosynthesis
VSIRVAIVGSVGVPARYGGFETLAEALVQQMPAAEFLLHVYCQRSAYADTERQPVMNGHRRIFVPLPANGAASMLYDAVSLLDAVLLRRCTVVLCLGASGTLLFPLLRLLCPWVRIVFNLDGLESRRAKWSRLGKAVLHGLEAIGIRFAHRIVADNRVIRSLVFHRFGRRASVIAYGGDHARPIGPQKAPVQPLPPRYVLAISRIVPENNIEMILAAFATGDGPPLVYVGNWQGSDYGQSLWQRYAEHPCLHLLHPIYDVATLNHLRSRALACVHGHSVGGTNPALVEALFWAPQILAFDCGFNRATLDGQFSYWHDSQDLQRLLIAFDSLPVPTAERSQGIQDRYLWMQIAKSYSLVFGNIEHETAIT